MPTVVDSLIITLGLDPGDFSKGKKQVVQDMIDLKGAAAKTGKDIAESGKKSSEFFSQLRGQVLLLFAAFSGGKSLKAFTEELTRSNAEVGRMATFLGATTRELSAIQGMALSVGGSSASATNSLNGLNMQLQQISLTGESSVLPYFRALGIAVTNANGGFKTATQLLPEIHRSFQGMEAARAQSIGHSIGLSDDLITILMKSDAEFNKFMEDQQRWGLVTKEQAKASQELQYSTTGVQRSFETLGRMIMTSLTPILIKFNEWLTKVFVWFQNHPNVLKASFVAIAAAVTALGTAMAAPIFAVFGSLIGAIGAVFGVGIAGALALTVAIAAAAAAVVLLYDDWMTWTTGGKSAFGSFYQYVLDKWNSWKDTILPIFNAYKQTWEDTVQTIKDGWDLLVAIFTGNADDISRTWNKLISGIKKMWVDTWDGLGGAVLAAGPRIFAAVKKVIGEAFGWAIDRVNTVYEAITGHKLFDDEPDDAKTEREAREGKVGAGGGSKGEATSSAENRAQNEADIQHLMSLGESREDAVAKVANNWHESGSTPKSTHMDTDHKIHDGLLQWSPERIAVYNRWAAANGKSPFSAYDRKAQLEFQHEETVVGSPYADSGAAAYAKFKRDHPTADEGGLAAAYQRFMVRPQTVDPVRSATANAIARENNILTRPPPPPSGVTPGAPMVAGNNDSSRTTNSTQSSTTKIDTININTTGQDADAIAKDIKPVLERDNFASQSNYNYY